ncbi:MAG: PEP-CTERM sorting domain-containing protein [Chlorobium sp.]|nr:MAG: PEP-CTERM sorting domain-containing protein [Chlorobium sp.]
MKKIIYLLIAFVMAVSSKPLHAAVGDLINIQVNGSSYNGEGAVTLGRGTFWNSISGTSEAIPTLFTANYSNVLSPAVITYSADVSTAMASGGVNGFNATPYSTLMDGYMASTTSRNITFTNLDANATYTLYVYSQKENTVPDSLTKTLINGTALLNTVNTSNSFISGTNYIATTVYSNASGALTFSYAPQTINGTNVGVINALQLHQTGGSGSAPTPEPASLVLLGVGGLFAARKKFRKKSA